MRPCLFLRFHEFGGFGWVSWVQEFRHDDGELFELNGLRHIRIEARFRAFGINVAENVRGKGNDGNTSVSVLLLPFSYLFACLVAVFVRHVQIAL